MSGETTVFPNKMDFNSIVVYYHYLMGQEAAKDGWEKEFEDLVDLLLITLHSIFKEDEMKKWNDVDDRGTEEDLNLALSDPLRSGMKKRKRIKNKLMLASKVIHRTKMGFKHIGEYKSDFDPESIPQAVDP